MAASRSDVLAPDPAIRYGVLPNGLRYAILSHAQPAGAISIQFRLKVGAINEGENERGVAHFLEHMAFAGGKRIPAGKMEAQFAGQGVAMGRDQNALTSGYDTTYRLDLLQATGGGLDLGFEWLRDVADGLDISPDAVDRERGVVISEGEAQGSPEYLQGRELRKALNPELRVTAREPIGTIDSLKTMDAPRLRAFYGRWYRPDNAIIVIVGDAPADALEARIKASFSSWKARGPRPLAPPEPPVDAKRGFDVGSWPTYGRLSDQVTYCVKRAPEPHISQTVEEVRRDALRQIWSVALNARLGDILRAADPPFHAAQVTYADDHREAADACLAFNPSWSDWRNGLKVARGELMRIMRDGPTQDEIDETLASRLSYYRYARDHVDGYDSGAISPGLLDQFDRDERPTSLAERYRAETLVGRVTPDDVRKQMQADWSGGGPILAVSTQSPPTLDDAHVYWDALLKTPLPGAYAPPAKAVWAYQSFGKPGVVDARETIADPGFERLRFANGVVLNFKEARFAKGEVWVNVSFGQGREGLGDMSLYAANIGAQLFATGGFGKNRYADLRKLFPGRLVSVSMGVDAHRYLLGGHTTAADFPVEMQLLGAYLTDPGFDSEMSSQVSGSVGDLYRSYATTPTFATSDALARAASPNNPLALPPVRQMAVMRADQFAAVFRPSLTTAPMEITVVGDLSERQALDAVAATLGAMPPRPALHATPNPAAFAHFPKTLDFTARASFAGAQDRGGVEVIWPLWVASPDRRREERALRYVAMLMQDAVRHRIRDKMGETYSPVADMPMDDGSDQGLIRVFVECTPKDAQEVLATVRSVAADMAAGKITSDELEAERKPMLAEVANRKTTLNWWMYVMDGSARNPAQVDDARTWSAVYGAISLDEVRAAAKTWLSGPGLAAVALPATPKLPTPAPAKRPALVYRPHALPPLVVKPGPPRPLPVKPPVVSQ